MLLKTHLQGRVAREVRRQGIVVPLVAISLMMLLGICAMVLDLGFMQDRQRHVQAAADFAAFAGAVDLFTNANSALYQPSTDPAALVNTSAVASAKTVATKNGYTDGSNNTSVTVNAPPLAGQFKGTAGYIEVIIQYNEPRRFSKIFGSSNLPVTCRAVARGSYTPSNNGILVLEPSASGALTVGGTNATAIVQGAPVIVDSSDNAAGTRNGGSTIKSNKGYDVTGNVNDAGGFTGGQLTTGTVPTPDPFAFLPQPSSSSLPNGKITKTNSTDLNGANYTLYTMYPGNYGSGSAPNIPNFTANDVVFMMPGIYYLNGGGFQYQSGGSYISYNGVPTQVGMIATGVLLYNAAPSSSNSNAISITGQGNGAVLWTPYNGTAFTDFSGTSYGGFPQYAGFSLWVNRNAPKTTGNTSSADVSITGNGSFNITGLMYAANSNFKVSGNGDSSIGAQFISRYLTIQGNGSFNVVYNPAQLPKARILQLVE